MTGSTLSAPEAPADPGQGAAPAGQGAPGDPPGGPADPGGDGAGPAAALGDDATLADRIGMIVGGQFVTTVITLVHGILMVRLISKLDYGTLAFVSMLSATARDLALLYIPESFLYFAARLSIPQLKGLVRQSMLLLAGLGCLVGLVLAGFALSPGIFLGGREDLTVLLILAGLGTIVGFPASVFANLFIVTDNHRKAAGISLVITILSSAGTLIPAALGAPIVWILVAQLASTALRLAMSWYVYAGLYPAIPAEPFPGGVRAQLAYVVPLAVSRFANLFNQKLDKVVVGLFFTAGLFAEFAVGSQELPLVSILPYTVASTMLPQFVERFERGGLKEGGSGEEGSREGGSRAGGSRLGGSRAGGSREAGARDAIDLWHASIRKTALVMLPVAAFLLLSAEPLMRVLYGDAYAGAALPFRIYSALLPLRVTGYGIMLMAFGQTRMILRAQVLGMVFNVAASLILLPTIGMVGAPLAAVLTQAMMIVFMLHRIERVGRVGLAGIFPWRHYGRVAATAALSGAPLAIALLTGSSRLYPALYLAAGAPLYLALYLAAARRIGLLEPEDRAFVHRWLRLEPLLKRPAA